MPDNDLNQPLPKPDIPVFAGAGKLEPEFVGGGGGGSLDSQPLLPPRYKFPEINYDMPMHPIEYHFMRDWVEKNPHLKTLYPQYERYKNLSLVPNPRYWEQTGQDDESRKTRAELEKRDETFEKFWNELRNKSQGNQFKIEHPFKIWGKEPKDQIKHPIKIWGEEPRNQIEFLNRTPNLLLRNPRLGLTQPLPTQNLRQEQEQPPTQPQRTTRQRRISYSPGALGRLLSSIPSHITDHVTGRRIIEERLREMAKKPRIIDLPPSHYRGEGQFQTMVWQWLFPKYIENLVSDITTTATNSLDRDMIETLMKDPEFIELLQNPALHTLYDHSYIGMENFQLRNQIFMMQPDEVKQQLVDRAWQLLENLRKKYGNEENRKYDDEQHKKYFGDLGLIDGKRPIRPSSVGGMRFLHYT